MFSPAIGDILFKATIMAQRGGASEIGLDTLLAALVSRDELGLVLGYCPRATLGS